MNSALITDKHPHPVVIVCLDEASAGELKRTECYRWVYANKPGWQKF